MVGVGRPLDLEVGAGSDIDGRQRAGLGGRGLGLVDHIVDAGADGADRRHRVFPMDTTISGSASSTVPVKTLRAAASAACGS